MKGKFKKKQDKDETRKEYRKEDLKKGVRGKYLESYKNGTNLVLICADVAEYFPTEESVNSALRSLVSIAQKATRNPKRPGRARIPA